MVLFIVFMVLKLTDTIDWSWWWVSAPLWVSAGIGISIAVGVLVAAGTKSVFAGVLTGLAGIGGLVVGIVSLAT